MTLESLVQRFEDSSALRTLLKQLSQGEKSIAIDGLQGSSIAIVLYLLSHRQKWLLVIARDSDEAAYLLNDLEKLSGAETVSFFPSAYKRAIRYGHKDLANEVIRSELMELLRAGEQPKIIVTYPEAVIEGVVDEKTYDTGRLELKVGDQIDRTALREKLWSMGFEEKDYVYLPGDFAVRGGIIDIYSFSSEYPARLDFFDNEVESIRLFDPESQLSQSTIEQVTILTSFEQNDAAVQSIISLLPSDLVIYIDQAAFLESSLDQTYTTPPIHPEDNEFATIEALQKRLLAPRQLLDEIYAHQCVMTNPAKEVAKPYYVRFGQLPEPLFHKNFELLSDALLKYQTNGYDTIIMSDQVGQLERLQSIFQDQAKGVTFESIVPTLHTGFIDDQQKLALFTDHTIFERYHNFKLKSDKIRKNRAVMTLKDIQSFEFGDYVVHQNYGIATFGGLFTIEQNGKQKETVRLNFHSLPSPYL